MEWDNLGDGETEICLRCDATRIAGDGEWIYVRPYVVTDGGVHRIEYESDYEAKSSRHGAINHGLREVGSDDFLVGEVSENRVVKLWWMDKERSNQAEIDRVNASLEMEDSRGLEDPHGR